MRKLKKHCFLIIFVINCESLILAIFSILVNVAHRCRKLPKSSISRFIEQENVKLTYKAKVFLGLSWQHFITHTKVNKKLKKSMPRQIFWIAVNRPKVILTVQALIHADISRSP